MEKPNYWLRGEDLKPITGLPNYMKRNERVDGASCNQLLYRSLGLFLWNCAIFIGVGKGIFRGLEALVK
jgi:hypothetical protein